jgi:hypothetical protein
MNPLTTKNRRNGKVARLPEAIRAKINKFLDDGFTYSKIIAELEKSTDPALPYKLTPDNLSNWFDGGYHDYLRDQERAERLKETTRDHMHRAKEDPVGLTAGTIHAATLELSEIMDDVATTNRTAAVANSDKFARMTNSLIRLSHMTLNIHRNRQLQNVLRTAKELHAQKPKTDH